MLKNKLLLTLSVLTLVGCGSGNGDSTARNTDNQNVPSPLIEGDPNNPSRPLTEEEERTIEERKRQAAAAASYASDIPRTYAVMSQEDLKEFNEFAHLGKTSSHDIEDYMSDVAGGTESRDKAAVLSLLRNKKDAAQRDYTAADVPIAPLVISLEQNAQLTVDNDRSDIETFLLEVKPTEKNKDHPNAILGAKGDITATNLYVGAESKITHPVLYKTKNTLNITYDSDILRAGVVKGALRPGKIDGAEVNISDQRTPLSADFNDVFKAGHDEGVYFLSAGSSWETEAPYETRDKTTYLNGYVKNLKANGGTIVLGRQGDFAKVDNFTLTKEAQTFEVDGKTYTSRQEEDTKLYIELAARPKADARPLLRVKTFKREKGALLDTHFTGFADDVFKGEGDKLEFVLMKAENDGLKKDAFKAENKPLLHKDMYGYTLTLTENGKQIDATIEKKALTEAQKTALKSTPKEFREAIKVFSHNQAVTALKVAKGEEQMRHAADQSEQSRSGAKASLMGSTQRTVAYNKELGAHLVGSSVAYNLGSTTQLNVAAIAAMGSGDTNRFHNVGVSPSFVSKNMVGSANLLTHLGVDIYHETTQFRAQGSLGPKTFTAQGEAEALKLALAAGQQLDVTKNISLSFNMLKPLAQWGSDKLTIDGASIKNTGLWRNTDLSYGFSAHVKGEAYSYKMGFTTLGGHLSFSTSF